MAELSDKQLEQIEKDFSSLDTDGSKDISKEEVTNYILARVMSDKKDYIKATVDLFFDKYDVNKDGRVTLEEFKQFYINKLKKH